MQRLTVMTLGAAAIGLCGFVYDASAQTPQRTCATHEATVYFAPESNQLNAYSQFAIEKMADNARACGAKAVVVQTSAGADQAGAVATALNSRGVLAVVAPMPALMPAGDTMLARSATLRVDVPVSAAS